MLTKTAEKEYNILNNQYCEMLCVLICEIILDL